MYLLRWNLQMSAGTLLRIPQGLQVFISSGQKPTPLQEEEVKSILKQTEEKKEKPMPKVTFSIGESVRVKDGPFTNFNGNVEDLNPAKGQA